MLFGLLLYLSPSHGASMVSAPAPKSYRQLATLAVVFSGMDLPAIDNWWKGQDEEERVKRSLGLEAVLRRHCEDCKSTLDIVNFKKALRLACHALPRDALNSLISSFGEGNKFPKKLYPYLSAATITSKLERELNSAEREILETPLFQVIPISLMTKFLFNLKVGKRGKFLAELSPLNLSLSALITSCKLPTTAMVLANSITREREAWLKTTGFHLSPLTRKAFIYLWQHNRPLFDDDPTAMFFLQLTFAVEYLFDLEFIRTPCPLKRVARLDEIAQVLRNIHAEAKIKVRGVRYAYEVQDYELVAESGASTVELSKYNDEMVVRFESIRLHAWITKSEADREQRVSWLLSNMQTEAANRTASGVRCKVAIRQTAYTPASFSSLLMALLKNLAMVDFFDGTRASFSKFM